MSTPSDTVAGRVLRTTDDLVHVRFDKHDGLVVVVAQDADDGRVLMVARADLDALTNTITTGQVWYRSRSRGSWHKGATSGNVQNVVELRLDCDGDTVLALVRPAGPSCHTGSVSCFGAYDADAIARLDSVIETRAEQPAPDGSYTAKLFLDRNLRMKKLGEEATELTVACADGDSARAVEEAADLVYHAAVALRAVGTRLGAVRRALASRER